MILPKSFGTKVVLVDFYDYNVVCLDQLKNLYDTVEYTIDQLTMFIKQEECPEDQLRDTENEIEHLIDRRNKIVKLMLSVDHNVISERVEWETSLLKTRLAQAEREFTDKKEQIVRELERYED
jgi:hypothetical protein